MFMFYFRFRNACFVALELSDLLVESVLGLRLGLCSSLVQFSSLKLRVLLRSATINTCERVQEVLITHSIRLMLHLIKNYWVG